MPVMNPGSIKRPLVAVENQQPRSSLRGIKPDGSRNVYLHNAFTFYLIYLTWHLPNLTPHEISKGLQLIYGIPIASQVSAAAPVQL